MSNNHSEAISFLKAIFAVNFDQHTILASSTHPRGMRHTRSLTGLDGTRDCYWSIAAFPADGSPERVLTHALRVRALVVDDVGTKVLTAAIEMTLGPPTAIVETSAGNFQWVYRLSTPVPVAQWGTFFAAVESRTQQKLEGRDAVHLFRLPMGVNTKPGRNKFPVKLCELNPGIELSVTSITSGTSGPPGNPGGPASGPGPSRPEPRLKAVGPYLSLIPNDDLSYDEWMARLHQAKALALDDAEAWEAVDAWSAKSAKYDPDETARRWATVDPTRTSGLVLLADAEAADPGTFEKLQAAEAGAVFDDNVEPPAATAAGAGGGYSLLHADMAAEIVRRERGLLGWLSNSQGRRWGGFDPVMGRWVVEDHDALMRSAVRLEIAMVRALSTTDEKTSKRLAEAKWQGSIQALLTRHRDLMIPFEKFDADLDMFGVPGGVVRLGAGGAVEEKGTAAQMVSKATSVRPAPAGTKGVAWEKFLDDFTMGDPELRAWWQAFCGYCLTGHISEHLVVFLYGPGGNGKSVFLDTLAEVMGPYHERAASAVFMSQQGSKHMAMVADLAGARLVTSPDVPLGASWDLGMLKPLTGGGTFKAQFMKENWFAFVPQFKLILAGNEKPILGTVDAAVRRRFVLVPAMHVPKRVNKQLVDVLRKEKVAILRWMLDGWEKYNVGGLPPCGVIERETADYIAEQDTFAKWVGATLTQKPGDMTRHSMSDLWSSWDAFRIADGAWRASPVRVQALSTKLKEAGFSVGRGMTGSYVDQAVFTKTTVF